MPSAQVKGLCAAPRPGNSSDRQGTALDEDLWLRSWTNELYLWFSEVRDIDPTGYTPDAYFPLLKTTAKTSTGSDKDKFHFTANTADYTAFTPSGTTAGYGWELAVIANRAPRQAYVAFTEPGSPAANQNIPRGASLLSVDGTDFVNGDPAPLNAGLSPAKAGESHVFGLRDLSGTTRTVTLVSANVTSTPVQNVKAISSGGAMVGYIQFNDHIATAEGQLSNAISTLKANNISDLVLDIRYNGGGYLYIASELAYMIAGPVKTAGQAFETTQFNSKYPNTDPVTTKPLTPTPFYNTATTNVSLPYLGLSRVFVLTGPGTCSASESIINGLTGVGVQVIQIGTTTCGKPYGFYPQDNCGTTYFTIEFRGVNAMSFGDYSDGFSASNSRTPTNAPLPGCSVADDFNHSLGDPLEARFAAALAYRSGGQASCPTPPATGSAPNRVTIQSVQSDSAGDVVAKSPLRENRWLQ